MAQPVLFSPSWTRMGTGPASRSQETRSLPSVSRTCRRGSGEETVGIYPLTVLGPTCG